MVEVIYQPEVRKFSNVNEFKSAFYNEVSTENLSYANSLIYSKNVNPFLNYVNNSLKALFYNS